MIKISFRKDKRPDMSADIEPNLNPTEMQPDKLITPKKLSNLEKLLSLREASELSGYHKDYLGQLMRGGDLYGFQKGRSWFTTQDALYNFLFQKKPERLIRLVQDGHFENVEESSDEPSPQPVEDIVSSQDAGEEKEDGLQDNSEEKGEEISPPSNTVPPPPQRAGGISFIDSFKNFTGSGKAIARSFALILLALIVIGGLIWFLQRGGEEQAETQTGEIPVVDLGDSLQITGAPARQIDRLVVNGTLELNGSFLLNASERPQDASAGQMYFDQDTSQLFVFDGTSWTVLLSATEDFLDSIITQEDLASFATLEGLVAGLVGKVDLQAATPGTAQTGNINITGTMIADSFDGTDFTGTSFSGDVFSGGTFSGLNANFSTATGTESPQLLLLENTSLAAQQAIGLNIQSEAGGIGVGIDLSDADILTALALGDNPISVQGTTIEASELLLLSGRSGTLLDSDNVSDFALTSVAPGGGLETIEEGTTLITSCVNGELLKWNGTEWICDIDLTGGGSNDTLQTAYNRGNTILTTDSNNILFTLADTATDSSFIVDIQGTGNMFEVQDAGSPVLTVADGGQVGINTAVTNEALTLDGRLSLLETTIPTNTANYGKLYVKSSDSNLYFMDSSGSETNLLAGAGLSGTGVAGEATFWTGVNTISSDPNFFWDDTSKFLGIGTNAPQEALHIDGGDIRLDNGVNFANLTLAALTGDQTITVPDATGTLCLDSNNCNFQTAGNYFLEGGNSFGAAATLGTNDTFDLALETDATTRLTILSTGEVAIGAGSPNELLTLEGAFSMLETTAPSATANYGKLYVDSSDSDLYFIDDSGASVNISGAAGSSISGTGTAGQATFWTGANTISGDDDFFWDDTGKLLGIGTNSPNELLTVEGVFSLFETTAPSQTANYGKLYVKATDSDLYYMDDSGTEVNISAAAGGSVSGTGSAGQLTFWTGGATISGDNGFFWDDTNKRVGIGTVSPSQALNLSDGSNVLVDAGYIVTPFGGFGRYENQLIRSEEHDNVIWTKTGLSVTPDSTTAPDGSTTADSIIDDATPGGNIAQAVSAGAAETWTYSVWLKGTGTQTVILEISDNGTPGVTTNSVTLGTAWKRYSVTHTTTAGTTSVNARIRHTVSTGNDTFYAWGSQLETQANSGIYARVGANAITTTGRGFVANGTGPHLLLGGNVGIGSIAPSELLSVEGRLALRETTAPSATSNYGKIYVKSSDGSLYFMNDAGTETNLLATAGLAGTGSTGQVTFWVNGSTLGGDDDFFWDDTNKFLGIATTAPEFPLDVSTDARVSGNLLAGKLCDVNRSNCKELDLRGWSRLNSDATVKDFQKISDTQGGFTAVLEDSDNFGTSVAGIGDLNEDSIPDIVVGARLDDDGGSNRGAVYVLFLDRDGNVTGEQKISDTVGNFTATMSDGDNFGIGVAQLGKFDSDNIVDIAVGAPGDNDGGTSRGAVYVLFMDTDGTVQTHQKISDTDGGFTATLEDNDNFGASIANIGDLDRDGVDDLAVSATLDDDGGNDRGAVYVLFMNNDGTVKSHQKISDTEGNFTGSLGNGDNFGVSIALIGDIDKDGVQDIAVGASGDDDGGFDRGAVYILRLNTDGTVKSHQKISDTEGNFTAEFDNSDLFGFSMSRAGDLNGDGIQDLIVGARLDDDGGNGRGATYVLFLNSDGTVQSHQKISDTQGGFAGGLADGDNFGSSVAVIGDLNTDGIQDFVIGARGDSDGGSGRGAVYVTFINKNNIHFADGNVGIGNSTPSELLTIGDGAGVTGNILISKQDVATAGTQYASNDLIFESSVWDATNIQAEDRRFILRNTAGSGADGLEPYRLSFVNNAGNEIMSLDGLNERVAIGTTSPSESLTVGDGHNIFAAGGSIMSPFGGFGRYENQLTFSEQLDNVAWTKTGLSGVTANATAAPDGSITADSVDDDGTGGGNVSQSAFAGAAEDWTFSVWIKDVDTTGNLTIRITDDQAGVTTQTFNPANEWRRYTVTHTTTAGTSSITARIDHDSTASNSFYAWGAQLEQQSNTGVYAKTEGTAITTTARGAATGKLTVTLDGGSSTAAICGSHGTGTSGDQAAVLLHDCDSNPAADYMEMYAAETGLETGDIVVPGTEIVTTTDGDQLPKLAKTAAPYQGNIIGIISDPEMAGDFNSIGYNIQQQDNPLPLALNGRVKVKVSNENGIVRKGDYITSSSVPGVGMKATQAGKVVGMALEDFDCLLLKDMEGNTVGEESCGGKIMVFVNPGYWAPTSAVQSSGEISNFSSEEQQEAEQPDFSQVSLASLKDLFRVAGMHLRDGVLAFKELFVEKLFTRELVIDANPPAFKKDPTIGTVELAGEDIILNEETGYASFSVSNDNITETSKVFVTLRGDYTPASRYWLDWSAGEFIIYFDKAPANTIKTDFWVVGVSGTETEEVQEQPEEEIEEEEEQTQDSAKTEENSTKEDQSTEEEDSAPEDIPKQESTQETEEDQSTEEEDLAVEDVPEDENTQETEEDEGTQETGEDESSETDNLPETDTEELN